MTRWSAVAIAREPAAFVSTPTRGYGHAVLSHWQTRATFVGSGPHGVFGTSVKSSAANAAATSATGDPAASYTRLMTAVSRSAADTDARARSWPADPANQ